MTPATSRGFSVVDFARDILGFEFLPWQRWLLIHAMELLPDGRFRFRNVLVLVARQNGKTSLVEIKNLWKMFVLGAQVLGTAQDLDVSEESWDNAVAICEGVEELAAEIDDIVRVNGKKALKLKNGARWKVKAANRRGGRGFSGDDINLDELREHQTWLAWSAVTKTTMARQNAQVWAYTNAGDDQSIVLNDLQAKARVTVTNPSADLTLGCFEWSVPDDVKCSCKRIQPDPHKETCRLADRSLWAMANPSYGYTISEDAMRSAMNTDPDVVFLTECLCQRVPSMTAGDIDPNQWESMRDPESKRVSHVAFGVDVEPDHSASSIAVWGLRSDTLGHGQLTDCRPGWDWVVPRLVKLRDELLARDEPVQVITVAMGRNTFTALETALTDAGFTVSEDPEKPVYGQVLVLTGAEMAAACGQMLDVIRDRKFRHIGQSELTAAAGVAQLRRGADTVSWSRRTTETSSAKKKPDKKTAVDKTPVSPLPALTAARWGFEKRAGIVCEAAEPEPLFAWG